MIKDLLIVGVLCAGVGTTASLALRSGGANSALVGSAAGALVGTVISSQQRKKVIQSLQNDLDYKEEKVNKLNNTISSQDLEIQNLKTSANLQNNLEILTLELSSLTKQVTELKEEKEELAKVKGQLIQKSQELNTELKEEKEKLGKVKGQLIQKSQELNSVNERLVNLEQQKQVLESRVATIQQKNPTLDTLEKLQVQIGHFSLDKSALEGEISSLRSQVESLEEKRRSLQNIEANYSLKRSELEQLKQQIEESKNQAQTLQTQKIELELLRATYDGLSQEKRSFETRVEQLRPEIERLEAEKQRILHEIQDHQQDYQNLEELRQRIRNLNLQIRDRESQLRDLETSIQSLNGELTRLQVKIADLQQQRDSLREEIQRFKGELENLSNSAEVAMQALREPLWSNLQETQWNLDNTTNAEGQFLQGFTTYLQSKGLTFSQRVVNAFHTSLKVQDISALVILAGISGTGKSELPQQYAHYIGAQMLTLAVQPRWDSPQDLQGFYNYVEKKFKPTDLMRGLYQYNHDKQMENRIVMVLLDEMNLARVEYYFSDFLSKLETRRSQSTYLEIDVGSLPLQDTERRLKIPEQFLFVGTMNEDETTQTLSDKVLDRANVLTFGKPENLRLRERTVDQTNPVRPSGYLEYRQFQNWTKKPDVNSPVVQEVKRYLDNVNNLMENMGHPFAHRVYQGITQYVVNYPGVESVNSPQFRFALADQFGQKLLPKLRGLMIDDYHEELDNMSRVIEEIADSPLTMAFEKARDSRSGQFQWKGLIYPEE